MSGGGRDPRFFGTNETNGTTKRCYFEKRTREVVDNTPSGQKTNPNEPKNEPEKLLKTRSCGKNEAENEAGHIVENKDCQKREPKTTRGQH